MRLWETSKLSCDVTVVMHGHRKLRSNTGNAAKWHTPMLLSSHGCGTVFKRKAQALDYMSVYKDFQCNKTAVGNLQIIIEIHIMVTQVSLEWTCRLLYTSVNLWLLNWYKRFIELFWSYIIKWLSLDLYFVIILLLYCFFFYFFALGKYFVDLMGILVWGNLTKFMSVCKPHLHCFHSKTIWWFCAYQLVHVFSFFPFCVWFVAKRETLIINLQVRQLIIENLCAIRRYLGHKYYLM